MTQVRRILTILTIISFGYVSLILVKMTKPNILSLENFNE